MKQREIYQKPWFVYILRCSNKYFYTGISPDVTKRIHKHRTGNGASFTRNKYPLELVYLKKYPTMAQAAQAERQMKRCQRSKKEQHIRTFQYNLSQDKDQEILDILALTT